MAKRIPPEIEADIVAAINASVCAYQISNKFKVDFGTVVRVAKRNNARLAKGHRSPDVDRLRQIKEASQQYGRDAAAKMFRIDPTTVSKSISRFYAAIGRGLR